MARPHRSESMMDTALIWAKRSTCDRLHVGAVFHREGRILVQGYNGAPAGLPHCDHICDCWLPSALLRAPEAARKPENHNPLCNSLQPCKRAVHAEQNAIAYAARWGVSLEGSTLTVTHQPCLTCALSIVNLGVESVTFLMPYRLKEGIDLLEEAGIKVWNMGLLFPAWSDKVEA